MTCAATDGDTARTAAAQQPLRVAVGLSGGVDSAVAAWRLLEDGHRVEAVFMKNWEEDDTGGRCAAAQDLADAEAVCARLGIPLRTVNFAAEYWELVFERFLAEHAAGRTPNPDILCNQHIKFDAFLAFCRRLDAGAVATGHYARIGTYDGAPALLKGRDPDKDQSYFLYRVAAEQLAHVRFPLGEMRKETVRALARKIGLPNADKRDSTGICFIGERDFRTFLRRFLPDRPGPILDPDGRTLGEHAGLHLYTIGQRQGLGIGGRRGADPRPWYVADKRTQDNALVVAQGHDHPLLYHRALTAGDVQWIGAPPAPGTALRCQARIRYRQPDQACTVEIGPESLRVEFDAPQWAVTPGQSVVLYAGERCLGGGVIQDRTP